MLYEGPKSLAVATMAEVDQFVDDDVGNGFWRGVAELEIEGKDSFGTTVAPVGLDLFKTKLGGVEVEKASVFGDLCANKLFESSGGKV